MHVVRVDKADFANWQQKPYYTSMRYAKLAIWLIRLFSELRQKTWENLKSEFVFCVSFDTNVVTISWHEYWMDCNLTGLYSSGEKKSGRLLFSISKFLERRKRENIEVNAQNRTSISELQTKYVDRPIIQSEHSLNKLFTHFPSPLDLCYNCHLIIDAWHISTE